MSFDRARAEKQRRLLQLRLERRRRSALFREVAPLLCELGLRPRKLPPAALAPGLACLADLPGRDERLHWVEIGDAVRSPWETARECASSVRHAAEALGMLDDRLALIFHPVDAGLMLLGKQLVRAWPVLHDRLYDTIWIQSLSDSLRLIEVSLMDRETCYSPRLGKSHDVVTSPD